MEATDTVIDQQQDQASRTSNHGGAMDGCLGKKGMELSASALEAGNVSPTAVMDHPKDCQLALMWRQATQATRRVVEAMSDNSNGAKQDFRDCICAAPASKTLQACSTDLQATAASLSIILRQVASVWTICAARSEDSPGLHRCRKRTIIGAFVAADQSISVVQSMNMIK